MAFAIFRVAPTSVSGLTSATKHQKREGKEPHIDRSKTHLNRVFVGSGDPKIDVLAFISSQKLDGKPPKSTEKLAAEMILTAKNDWFSGGKNGKKVDVDGWAQANIDLLRVKYGDRLVSASLHLDEQTPHLHAFVVPISTYEIATGRGGKSKKTVTRLSYFREFGDEYDIISKARETGNTEILKLGKLQTWYAEGMKSAGFDLERGIRNSRATHKTIAEFQKALAGLDTPMPNAKVPKVEMPKSEKKIGIDTGLFSSDSLKKYGVAMATAAFQDGWKRRQGELITSVAAKQVAERVRTLETALVSKDKELTKMTQELTTAKAQIAKTEASEKDLAGLMRGLPAGDVLQRLGYQYDIVADAYQTELGFVSVDGGKITVEHHAGKVRNPLDLVMALHGCDYVEALGTLRDKIGEVEAQAIAMEAARKASAPSPLPSPDAGQWWAVRDYLVNQRGLPQELVEQQGKKGAIYADGARNCCFRLGSEGVEMRGSRGPFHGTRGEKALYALPSPTAKAVVYVESAIEALSYRSLFGDKFAIFSTGGENKKRLLEHAKAAQAKGLQVICAFNADKKGAKYVADLQEAGIVATVHTPPLKDWNETLVKKSPVSPPPAPAKPAPFKGFEQTPSPSPFAV